MITDRHQLPVGSSALCGRPSGEADSWLIPEGWPSPRSRVRGGDDHSWAPELKGTAVPGAGSRDLQRPGSEDYEWRVNMYGNYPHFMKFPTSFGGECGTFWTVLGRWRGYGGPLTGLVLNPLCVHACALCLRVSVRVHERGERRPWVMVLLHIRVRARGSVCGSAHGRPAGSCTLLQRHVLV